MLRILHGIKLSLRQLKRILKTNNLSRRANRTPDNIVRDHISAELQSSSQCIGYRCMWQRLVRDHHLNIARDSVLRLMREIDPQGVNERKMHRLARRKYISKGPNFIWHVDGYDKLKPYGFCIHGAIDGYSRRILWLEISNSNNSPSVIATYYLDTLKELGFAPRLLRCDRGTENSRLALLQPYFRYNGTDSVAGVKSFMYGKSVSNQRIESWWGLLRRQGIHWWISFFKDMVDANTLDTTDKVQIECLRYCFMDLIQSELDRIAMNWNNHEIRPQKHRNIPSGRPEIMFHVPEVYGGYNFGHVVNKDDVTICQELYGEPKRLYADGMNELAQLLSLEHRRPNNAKEALELYTEIMQLVNDVI
ncbi:hypothetical protein ACF0H5_001793 [Mactra antiquata]